MIKHFRNKFIAISTAALLVVLITLIGSISALTYFRTQQEVNNILTILVSRNGKLRSKDATRQPRNFFASRTSREGMFQYRYFSAQVSKKDNRIMVNGSHIITVDPPQIKQFARIATSSHHSSGKINSAGTTYAYRVKSTPSKYIVVFLDESILMSETKEIIRLSIIIGIISMVLYTLVLILFSKRAIKPIIQAEKRQKEFITNAGHELKTPLAVISANNEMQEMIAGESEWTKSNRQQVERLTKLVNNLISLARMEEYPEFHLVQADISQIIQEAAANFKNLIQQDGKKFKVDIAPGLKATVDTSYLAELVNILLDNANKYCDPKGQVIIKLREIKGSPRLIISNSYADGKDVDYNKFFNRFYRADVSHHFGKKSGFGIGLAMAQKIVAAFKGSIKANYHDGMISFIVTFK